MRRVQRRCVWAVGRLGNESNAGVDRYDRPMHSDADQARREEMKWGVVKKWTFPPRNETKLNQTLLFNLRF